jgi:microcystin-dependent protein
MSTPFVGEIRMGGWTFAPSGWFMCDGRLLPIDQYNALFALIGTTYGGDGQTTFGLPDMRSRAPIHQGTNPNNGITYVIGQLAGEETVTLLSNQMPQHNHNLNAQTAAGTQPSPSGGLFAESALEHYSSNAPTLTMGTSILNAGGSQPHENMNPFQAVTFVIAWAGIFPSRN